MTAWEQIKIGFKSYSLATKLAFSKKFIVFMIFPLLLNVALLWFGLDFISELTEKTQTAFSDYVNIEKGDFWGAEYLKSALSGFIWLVIKILFFVIFAYTGGYIIVIILSPVFSVVSEKTEKYVTGKNIDVAFSVKQLFKDILRGLIISLRNFTIENLIMIVVFIVGFIPVIGFIGPFFMFFVTSYFFGFSYMDLTNERRKRTVKQSVVYVWKYKWVAMANGTFFSLALFIPLCGVSVSAFIAIISVIAGTISMIEIERKTDNEQITMNNLQ